MIEVCVSREGERMIADAFFVEAPTAEVLEAEVLEAEVSSRVKLILRVANEESLVHLSLNITLALEAGLRPAGPPTPSRRLRLSKPARCKVKSSEKACQ